VSRPGDVVELIAGPYFFMLLRRSVEDDNILLDRDGSALKQASVSFSISVSHLSVFFPKCLKIATA